MSSSVPAELTEALAKARSAPDSDEAWDELDELAREANQPDDVSKLYLEVLAGDLPAELTSRLGERAVAFHEEWFEDTSHVIDILRRVLSVDAAADWAFERLSLLLTMAERWDDLLAEYDRALEVTDEPDKKKGLLDEAARIAKDFAGQTNRAIGYLKALVPLRPEDAQLAQSLERRLVLQKRFADLIDVWTARLGVMSDAEAMATRVRIAETWLRKLKNAATALETVQQLIGTGGAAEEACRLLEMIGTAEQAEQETRRAALGFLKEQQLERGLESEVIKTIELQLAVAEGEEELAGLRREARERLASAERYDEAVAHGGELLVLAPTPAERDRLRELVDLAGAREAYVDALVRGADAAEEPAVRVAFVIEAGCEAQDRLEDGARAILLLSRALGDEAAEADQHLDVSRRLTTLLAGDEHAAQRLTVLERRAALEPEVEEQRRVLGEAAQLAATMGDADHALALWRRRLERAPGDLEALDASAEILEQAERWESLVGLLEQRATAYGEGTAERRADLVRIASVYQRQLDNVEKAIEVWRGIQEEYGSNPETIDALANLSAVARRWTDVVGLLRAAADGEEDAERRANQLARMGDVYREERNSATRAVESYREAVIVDPRHERARAGLRALLDHPESGRDAVETLTEAYKAADEWEGVIELVERRIALSPSADFRKAVLVDAATIRETRAQDLAGALLYLRRAFAVAPEPELEQELRRLAEATGDFEAAAAGYAEAIEGDVETERREQLLMALGAILEERLADFSGALASYERVARGAPAHVEAARAVARVGSQVGAWPSVAGVFVACTQSLGALDTELVDTLEQTVTGWDAFTGALDAAIESANELKDEIAHALLERLALWHRDRREDAQLAEDALERAVAKRADPQSLRMLAEIQREAPGRSLVSTLLKLADATDDDLDALHEAGNVALLAVQDRALATPILERVLSVAEQRWQSAAELGEDATGPERFALWAIDHLVQIRLDEGNAAEAVELLVRGASAPCEPEVSRQLRFRAAETAAEALGDSTRAVELCTKILEEAPDDAGAMGLLASLYAKEGRLSDLMELRRRELALEPPTARRLELRLDIARVLGDLEGDLEERVAALRDNLADEPGHAESVDTLAALLEGAERHAELLDVLCEQAARVQEVGEVARAAALWARAGQLAEEPVGNVDRALDAYRRSVDLDPSLPVLDALSRIHTERQQFGVAVKWLEQRLARTGRSEEELGAYRDTVYRLAKAQDAAGQEERARETLVEALREDPAATELRELLASLYRETEEWALLAPLLADGVDYVEDAGAKVALLRQAAQVHRRRLGDVEAAIPLLKRAVELEPKERAPRLALADALRVGERYDEARELLAALLEEFGRRRTPERAAVHFHLARIAQACGDLDEALAQLESASSIERSDARILQLLGTVARQKGDLDRAERAYRALLLIVRRQQATEDEEDLVAGSEIMYDLHRIAAEQGQNDRANDLLESAFETAAENNFEALRLERALRAAGQTQHVLRVLDTRLARIDEPSAATEILCARADLLAELDRVEEALDSLLEALARTPGSAKLSAAAYELAVRADAVSRYVERLSQAAESAEEPRSASALWYRLGQTAEKDLEDPAKAADFYEKSLATGFRAHRAYQALVAVLPEDDAERRASALRSFALAPEDAEGEPALRTEALYTVAATEFSAAETCEAGVEHLEEALQREVRTEEALSMLRGAATLVPTSERVIRAFERVAREAGHPDVLLEALVLTSRLDSATVDLVQDAIDLARQQDKSDALSRLLERLVDLARATEDLSPFAWAMTELAAMREAAGDGRGAVDLLQEASGLSDGANAFELRLRVANIASGSLDDTELAASTYEALLEQEPADARVWQPLLDLYRRMGARDRLEACISKTIDVVLDPAERNTLRMERGRILLDDPERAEEAETILRDVLDEDPDHVQASFVLAELLERAGRTEELASLLERQLDGARERGDADAVGTLSLRIGTALEETSPEDALTLYKDSLEVAPGSRPLLEAMLRLLGPDGDPHERADLMERLLAVAEGPEGADLALELASLRRSLDDSVAAERALAMGFRACPTRSDIREQLEQLYEETENFVGLAELIALDAGAREDVEAAVARFRRAASIYFDDLGDPTTAASVLARARARAPGDVSLTELQIQYLTVAGRSDEALALITEACESDALGPQERAGFLSRRAQLRLEMGDADLETLASALQDADRAFELTDGGYRELVAQLLERQREAATGVGDEAAERGATMRLAALLPALGDHRRGLELLVGWVKRFPEDAAAVRELGHFAAASEKWQAAAKAYQRLVEITEGDEQIDAVVRLAEACEKAETPMAAKEALELVYARAPQNDLVRARLRRMYESAEEYGALAAIIMAEAEQAEDDDVRFQRLVEAADLSMRVQGGERTAIAAYRRALDLRPDDNDTAIRLADTLALAGEIEEAANLLDAAINAHGKRRSPELSQLQHSMARVGRIAQDDEAVLAWLEAAVQSDRQNGAAAAELAVLAMERGELDMAVKALQAVALLKEPGPMSRAEAYLRQGMIAEQKGDRKKAIFLAKRALTTEPEYQDAKLFLEQVGG